MSLSSGRVAQRKPASLSLTFPLLPPELLLHRDRLLHMQLWTFLLFISNVFFNLCSQQAYRVYVAIFIL